MPILCLLTFRLFPDCRSVVYLEIDNRQCYQQSSECFQSATDVAAFLGALASSGNLNVPYIEAVTSTWLYITNFMMVKNFNVDKKITLNLLLQVLDLQTLVWSSTQCTWSSWALLHWASSALVFWSPVNAGASTVSSGSPRDSKFQSPLRRNGESPWERTLLD